MLKLVIVFATLLVLATTARARVIYDFDAASQLLDFSQKSEIGSGTYSFASGSGINGSGAVRGPVQNTIVSMILPQPLDPTQVNTIGISVFVPALSAPPQSQYLTLHVGVVDALNHGLNSGNRSELFFGMDDLNGGGDVSLPGRVVLQTTNGGSIGLPATGGGGSGVNVPVNHWYRATFNIEPVTSVGRYAVWGSLDDLGAKGISTPQRLAELTRENEFIGGVGLYPSGSYYPAFSIVSQSTGPMLVDNFSAPEPGAVVIVIRGLAFARTPRQRRVVKPSA